MNLFEAEHIKVILNKIEAVEKELKYLYKVKKEDYKSIRIIKEDSNNLHSLHFEIRNSLLWYTKNKDLIKEMVQSGIDYLEKEKSFLLKKLEKI